MSNNYEELNEKSRRSLFAGLFGLFILIPVLIALAPSKILGVSSVHLIFPVAAFCWLAYLAIAIPRCPKCGMGVLSYIEALKVPLFVRMSVGETCAGCGLSFKNEPNKSLKERDALKRAL